MLLLHSSCCRNSLYGELLPAALVDITKTWRGKQTNAITKTKINKTCNTKQKNWKQNHENIKAKSKVRKMQLKYDGMCVCVCWWFFHFYCYLPFYSGVLAVQSSLISLLCPMQFALFCCSAADNCHNNIYAVELAFLTPQKYYIYSCISAYIHT